MKKLSIHEQYDYFINAFDHIGTFLLTLNVEDIEYYVFEEFDSECTSFLHRNTLSALLTEKLISEDVFFLSLQLAEKFRDMENTSLWNSMSVKRDPRWLEILIIADRIKSLAQKS